MRLFRGFRNTISNVAQIILVVILLPFVAIVIRMISGVGAGGANMTGMLSSLIGNIPLCEVWMDVLYQYAGGLTAADVATSTVLVILKALPEALISAICVHTCVRIEKVLKTMSVPDQRKHYGLPIFSTFVGIVIATVITSLTGLTHSVTSEILMDFGAIIIMLIGFKILFRTVFRGRGIFEGKKILLFIIDGLFAVITTAYISGLLLAAKGAYASTGQAIGIIFVLTGIEIIAAVVVCWISKAVDPELE